MSRCATCATSSTVIAGLRSAGGITQVERARA